ncbi:siderophore biosynthesis protein [Streptomyces sp. F63]|nr:siderophore biosynthesis protein [Streptomyces sp. F63]
MTLPARATTGHHRPGDPAAIADAVTTGNLLRCWIRETGTPRPTDGILRLRLPASGTTLEAPVIHWSPTGHHRFGRARLHTGTKAPAPLIASLLGIEIAAGDPTSVTDLTSRVTDSAHRIEQFLRTRPHTPTTPGTTPFLDTEQALITGHPLHPTPKSREGLSDTETAHYSPELHGHFPLHWFAADPAVLHSDTALGQPLQDLLAELAGHPTAPPGTHLVPAHPWQAHDLLHRPAIRTLLDDGHLHHLGPSGPHWTPTSSVRTLYRPDAPVMLKLSLGIRITNSRRENNRTELRRGLAVHRLLDAGLAHALHTTHPHFHIVRDPAWIAVDTPGTTTATTPTGLDAVIRDNPFRTTTPTPPGAPRTRTGCLAGLLAERPDQTDHRSRLAHLIQHLAQRTGQTTPRTARAWFTRYLDTVITPLLWLYAEYGLGLEAHQQNTLVTLDTDGWPTGGHYRDNQGYYFSPTRSQALHQWIPGAGRDLGTYVDDTVIDERLGYYIGINNILGTIGALGSQGLADETDLLAETDRHLAGLATRHGNRLTLATTLREAPTLRCKANLLTRIHGMDELIGPLENQSVYVDIPNPIAEARR